jgi:hypothetical protein
VQPLPVGGLAGVGVRSCVGQAVSVGRTAAEEAPLARGLAAMADPTRCWMRMRSPLLILPKRPLGAARTGAGRLPPAQGCHPNARGPPDPVLPGARPAVGGRRRARPGRCSSCWYRGCCASRRGGVRWGVSLAPMAR